MAKSTSKAPHKTVPEETIGLKSADTQSDAKKVKKKSTIAQEPVAKKTQLGINSDDRPHSWDVIHVFGFGQTQIIGNGFNGSIASTELESLDPLLNYLNTKQQKSVDINETNMHALNIMAGSFINFVAKPGKSGSQRFEWADIDTKLADELAKELLNKLPNLAYPQNQIGRRRMFNEINKEVFMAEKLLVKDSEEMRRNFRKNS